MVVPRMERGRSPSPIGYDALVPVVVSAPVAAGAG